MYDFINEYFIRPMVERTGYNPVNTITYALIALSLLFIVYRVFRKYNIRLDNYFFYTLISFIAFGSTKRVVTDATDKIFFNSFINSLYQYNFFNISPGIYIFTASLFFIALFIERKFNIKNFSLYSGLLLFFFHFFILLPHFSNIYGFIAVLFMGALVFVVSKLYFKKFLPALLVFAHSFDGAATFIAIDFFGYSEQHVVASFIGENFGYFAFFLLKFTIAFVFAYLLEKEKMDAFDKNFFYAIAITAGLSPGLRDVLRLALQV